MSGWLKIDKDLPDAMRFRRVVRAVRNANNALCSVTGDGEQLWVTITLGAITRLWGYADSHIGDDNVLAVSLDEINELVGVKGFAQALPAEWLVVIDPDHVQLPDFLEHNGTSAKQRKDNARRQATYRHNHHSRNVTDESRVTNASNDAIPAQTRPDQISPDQPTTPAAPPTAEIVPRGTKPKVEKLTSDWWLDFKLVYPERDGDQGWAGAQKAANARMAEGHSPEDFLAGARRYGAYCAAAGKTGSEYVKAAKSFLGPERHFLQPWDPPRSNAQRQVDSNVSVGLEYLRERGVGT